MISTYCDETFHSWCVVGHKRTIQMASKGWPPHSFKISDYAGMTSRNFILRQSQLVFHDGEALPGLLSNCPGFVLHLCFFRNDILLLKLPSTRGPILLLLQCCCLCVPKRSQHQCHLVPLMHCQHCGPQTNRVNSQRQKSDTNLES